MQTYSTWVDPRAHVTRQMMREQAPRDIASGTMRLALHLSTQEEAYLEQKHPESLGLPPGPDRDRAWRKFIESPASAPYKVNKV